MHGREAGCGTLGTASAMGKAGGTGVVSGGIPSGMVTAHAGLTMAECSVVVAMITEFGFHESVGIMDGFHAMPNGVERVTTVIRTIHERLVSLSRCS